MKTKLLLMLAAAAMFAVGNVARGDMVTRTIQAEYDDGEEYLNTIWSTASYAQGAGWLDSSDLEVGSEGAGGLAWQVCAVQYDQLGIPAGATIFSAKITFTVDNSGNTGTSNDFTIFAEATGNASVFSWHDEGGWAGLDPFNITSRDRTAASVSWAPAAGPAVGTTLDTPDISALIKEVVDRAGWSANNRLTLMVYPDVYLALPNPATGGSTSVQEIEFEAGPGSDSATLTVEYEPVKVGDVDLSWTNMLAMTADPNIDPVWVDVWFGTDPNVLTMVVDASEDQTSVTVSAPDVGTYYWQVNWYLYGDPASTPYGGPGEPNMIEGYMRAFYAVDDLAPSVDAGIDMITWSGGAVQLDPTVVDDGASDLTYAWSAYSPDGVVFSDPGPAAEAPTVTIDKSGFLTTLIVNRGFESPALDDGNSTYDVTGWTEAWYDLTDPGVWSGYSYSAGAYDPDATNHGYGGIAYEGENVAFVTSYGGYDMGMGQILSVLLQANTQYVLSAMVGNPYIYNGGTTNDYRIELVAGDVVLETDTGPSPNGTTDPNWFDVSLTHNSGAAGADPNVSQPLEIRLIAVDNGLTGWEVDFDDVKLTATPGYPFPAVHTVTLTLAVNDEGNPTPVTDTMTIDVYDDACLAALATTVGDYPADFDESCKTGLEDLAVMLSTWLNYTGLTEPHIKY